ncbi:uncharacterized protein Z518_04232 [Rhinocladiella mackenziei CBS 650.93]|uniref:DUF541 domain-containing protein n=1 Tax=Rhinocladiella mackenziei CBS 650.93 TaxID=1442369 RepID=A0A0D2FVR7_9EURO|nr:uncharacterized protein Z518_04232 [Rhinocladiella mackenziei CBS 650.93]KIX06257.1 hypothetical protein Z518_04232 [Rhinocladiella mackenziei CBS 650.93]
MVPTVITINSTGLISAPAERAALIVDVIDSGYDKDEASTNVVTTVNNLQAEIDELCPRLSNGDISPEAPVSFYSIASLSTSSRDEFDKDNKRTGKQIQTVYSKLDIRFRDFAKLGEMVVHLSTVKFVQLKGVTWKLTDQNQSILGEEARMKALVRAMKRAEEYGRVIGRNSVTAVKIEDSEESYPRPCTKQTARKSAASWATGIGVGIDFEPQTIDVSASLVVEFHAE